MEACDFYEPLPEQARFHQCQDRLRLVAGGCRSGMTKAGAVEVAVKAMSSPCRIAVYGYDFMHIGRNVYTHLFLGDKPLLSAEFEWRDKSDRQFKAATLANGSVIEGHSMKEEFTDQVWDWCWLDANCPEFFGRRNIEEIIARARLGSWWTTMPKRNEALAYFRSLATPFRLCSLDNHHCPGNQDFAARFTGDEYSYRILGVIPK